MSNTLKTIAHLSGRNWMDKLKRSTKTAYVVSSAFFDDKYKEELGYMKRSGDLFTSMKEGELLSRNYAVFAACFHYDGKHYLESKDVSSFISEMKSAKDNVLFVIRDAMSQLQILKQLYNHVCVVSHSQEDIAAANEHIIFSTTSMPEYRVKEYLVFND